MSEPWRSDRLDHGQDVLDAMIQLVDHGGQPPLEADADLDLTAEPQVVVGDIAEQAADDAGQREADGRDHDRRLLRALHGVVLGIVAERPVAAAESHGAHHGRCRIALLQRAQGDDALLVGDILVAGVVGVLKHHRKQRAVVIGQHQRREFVGKRDEADRLGAAFVHNGRREHDPDRPVLPQHRDRV
jgi:hypothetical protein